MECDEFARKLLENPANRDADFIEHSQTCDACKKHYLAQMAIERQLKKAFSEEKNPALSEKIYTAYRQEKAIQKRRWLSAGWFTAFAGIFFAAFLGVKVYQNYSLSEFVLTHIDHEYDQLENEVAVSTSLLGRFYQEFQSHYFETLPKVVYVEKCWMRTGFGLHMIVAGEQGPVTVLLMPNEPVETVQMVESERFSGKIFPVSKGSIALVGEQGESIDRLAEKIRMAM